MMHSDRTGLGANFIQHGCSGLAIVKLHLDFDQLVRFEACFNFVQHFFTETIIAYHDHRMQIMTQGAQMAYLFGVKISHMSLIQKGSQFSR